MRISMFAVALLSLAACGGEGACENYVDAATACFEDAGATVPGDIAGACDNAPNDSADLFNCYADAYDSNTCDLDGAADLAQDLADCTGISPF